jgi:heat-inducible transcriptional repressor
MVIFQVHVVGVAPLEVKKRILELLDCFLEQPSGEIAVHVGLGEMHPSMRQLSLIGVSVILPTGVSAVIAVLGPMRMNYGRDFGGAARGRS